MHRLRLVRQTVYPGPKQVGKIGYAGIETS